jgi:hypothetical protein
MDGEGVPYVHDADSQAETNKGVEQDDNPSAHSFHLTQKVR